MSFGIKGKVRSSDTEDGHVKNEFSFEKDKKTNSVFKDDISVIELSQGSISEVSDCLPEKQQHLIYLFTLIILIKNCFGFGKV